MHANLALTWCTWPAACPHDVCLVICDSPQDDARGEGGPGLAVILRGQRYIEALLVAFEQQLLVQSVSHGTKKPDGMMIRICKARARGDGHGHGDDGDDEQAASRRDSLDSLDSILDNDEFGLPPNFTHTPPALGKEEENGDQGGVGSADSCDQRERDDGSGHGGLDQDQPPSHPPPLVPRARKADARLTDALEQEQEAAAGECGAGGARDDADAFE
jgi:hypothetical protein